MAFNRIRQMGSIQPIYLDDTWTLCSGVTTDRSADWGLKKGFTKLTRDNVTPHFHSLVKKGVIVNKQFSSTLTERDDTVPTDWSMSRTTPCSSANGEYVTSSGNTRRYGPNNPNLVVVPSVDLWNLQLLAGTEAMAGVAEPDFGSTVFLAEFSETMRMVHNPFRSMERTFKRHQRSNAYKTWRAKNRQKNRDWTRPKEAYASDGLTTFSSPRYNRVPPRTPQEVERASFMEWMGERWLEYRYGITPLIRDLNAAIDILRNEPTQQPRYTSRGKASHNPSNIVQESLYPEVDFNFKGTVKATGERWATCRAGVLYTHELTLESRTGWTLNTLPEATWEGIPFSFVVDWFLNVGEWIRAMQAKLGVKVLATWHKTTVWTRQTYDVNTVERVQAGWSSSTGPCYKAVQTVTQVDRYPWLEVGLAYEPQPFDLGQEKWRKRTLDVVSAMTYMFGPVRRKPDAQPDRISRRV